MSNKVPDIVGERQDEARKVREFLYVDHQRIRSYYSQINRGIIESIVSREEGNLGGKAGARLFGFGPTVSAGRTRDREESRSLQDLNYVIFEELFENEKLIRDITDRADNLESWNSGKLYNELDEGNIVKYCGNIQILDPQFIKDRFKQFAQMVKAIAGSQVGAQEPEPGTPPQRLGGRTQPGRRLRSAEEVRERLIAEKIEETSGGISLDQIASLSDFVGAFPTQHIGD